jgi:hypothetical protein
MIQNGGQSRIDVAKDLPCVCDWASDMFLHSNTKGVIQEIDVVGWDASISQPAIAVKRDVGPACQNQRCSVTTYRGISLPSHIQRGVSHEKDHFTASTARWRGRRRLKSGSGGIGEWANR